MKATLIEAIQNRSLVRVICKGYTRVVQPYLLYESKSGNETLHGWQVSGEYDKTSPPDWCNLNLKYITAVTVLEDHYGQPHPDYNPNSKGFYRVLASTPKGRIFRSAGG